MKFIKRQPPPSVQKGDSPHFHQDLLDELALLLRSRYGLIWLETLEEERAQSLLELLADRLCLRRAALAQ